MLLGEENELITGTGSKSLKKGLNVFEINSLDRLRRDGEGEQRLCTPRRVRLERRGDLGLALPARPQGPLRQRQTREGLLRLRYAQLHHLAARGQGGRRERLEGVHRLDTEDVADDLPARRGAEHQEVYRRGEVQQGRGVYLIIDE